KLAEKGIELEIKVSDFAEDVFLGTLRATSPFRLKAIHSLGRLSPLVKKRTSNKSSSSASSKNEHLSTEKIFLTAACFLAGASIMIVELAGNRLITPLFGNTMFTWTGLIGVVLVAIAAGDFLGGWLVDRRPDFKTLGLLFFAAGVTTLLVYPVFLAAQDSVAKWSPVTGPILASLLLFSVPAFLLASVSPFIVRLLSRQFQDEKIGLSAGLVGMWGTLGSFLGTIGAGLFLIPNFSLTSIFVGVALCIFLLGVFSVLIFGKLKNKALLLFLTVAFMAGGLGVSSLKLPLQDGEIAQHASFYHNIRVHDQKNTPSKTLRFLQLDTTMEGAQIVESGELVFGYQKFWELLKIFAPTQVKESLFIGGGGFGMPEQLSKTFRDSAVTIVEIDPAIIEIGKKYFRLADYPDFRLVTSDGRRFLREEKTDYDIIVGDAYSGVHTVPSHLTSLEFFRSLSNRLKPEGVFFMNLISAHSGKYSGAFRWLYRTLQQIFPSIMVFGVEGKDYSGVQNLVIVASKSDLEARLQAASPVTDLRIAYMLASRIDLSEVGQEQGGGIIRDARNPMEWLMAKQVGAARTGR
ncbi:MAG: fused MFS/spermidine synthase, partial [Chthoniobacterales bacterium]